MNTKLASDQAERAKLQFCLFDFDDASASAPERISGTHQAPPGWTFESGDAERWPGAIVGVIHPPLLPAMSGQFSEWALCSVAPAQAEALARANFKHELLIYGRQAA